MRTQSKFFATAILLLAIVPACKFNCSIGGPTTAKVEEGVMTNDYFKNLNLKSVTCPKDADVEWKAGNTFKCKGEGKDGTAYSFTVTIKTDDGEVNVVEDK